MTEKIIEHTLSIAEIHMLSGLVGQHLKFVGGENLDAYSLAESIVVASESDAAKIFFGLTDAKFEGFDDEYPLLGVVKPSKSDQDMIEKLGNFNVALTGLEITGVSILRDVITSKHLGSTSWTLQVDMGVIVHLGQAAISFVNLTDYDIVCKLTFHADFDPSELPSSKTLQESDLVDNYEVSRLLISVPKEAQGD